MRICFVGGGNMATSLVGGLIADGVSAEAISVSDPDPAKRAALAELYSIRVYAENEEAVNAADVVVLAVKPQAMKAVAQGLAPVIALGTLVISIAAGIRLVDLQRWLGGSRPLVRSMPNTPALVQSGATALFANDQVSEAQRIQAESIMRAVGISLWVDKEEQMDAVTALSGSGPAYFFLVMEVMERAGISLGLAPETARLLTLETAFGAAKMALESSDDSATLRAKVTSPGGTTEQALKVMQDADLSGIFQRALQAASRRSQELARLLGEG